MIIKGKSVGGAKRLAVHLTRTDTNERVAVVELRGVAAEDLRGALLEMEAVAAGARTTKPFYHGSINTLADERLTPEQRMQAIDRLEEKLGLTDQARIVVVHEKEGREHCHIVWSRIDLERMAAISDSHNFRKHEEVARDLEREFGHQRVQGAHVERDGKERPERTPSHAEMLQAERTGFSAKEVREQITALWQRTERGQDFAVALWEAGYVLARGDRRDFVVIDPNGGTHSLSRRVDGATAKDIRARMADLDPGRLYGVTEAKEIQRNRQERNAQTHEAKQEPEHRAEKERLHEAQDAYRGRTDGMPERPAAGLRAADGIAGLAGKAVEGLAGIAESLLGGPSEPPPPPTQNEISAAEHRAAEAAKEAQQAARLHQETDDMTKERQEAMRRFGREIADELRREQELGEDRDRGRDRSR